MGPEPQTRKLVAASTTLDPPADHWMLTLTVLLVTFCTAAAPSPLMVGAGMLALCYLAPSEVLPAMLGIGAVFSAALLILL